jgi:hypothetical protein
MVALSLRSHLNVFNLLFIFGFLKNNPTFLHGLLLYYFKIQICQEFESSLQLFSVFVCNFRSVGALFLFEHFKK